MDDTVAIYLDYNATAPVLPAAADLFARLLRDTPGNASSVHRYGQAAKAVVDAARDQVAALVGGDAAEVVFTSGCTEADNLAMRGLVHARRSAGRPGIVVAGIEHEAVLNTAKALAKDGWELATVPADADGVVDLGRLDAAVTERTAVVALMLANN